VVTQHTTTERPTALGARFAATKFRPPRLPPTLVSRPALHERLTQSVGRRLTVVVGSAGAGKTVLLADWAIARPPGATAWLSCDRADADQLRFWAGFIEASRAIQPEFGGDAIELLAMDGAMSADVAASIADDAAHLPAGSAIIADDFHFASAAAAKHMNDLVGHWPAETVQLVLSSRFDPPLRLHRLRMSGELCELRDPDLGLSLAQSHDLLANLGVHVADADLRLLHERSEGWAAALQMVALSLRGASDPDHVVRALTVHRHVIAEYFISEVLDQQPPEMAQFMLDTSVLGELTASACAAVTRQQDAPALLRRIDAANLFLVALDEERTTFRYHRLVRQLLRAELRARNRGREQMLHQRAAEWYEVVGNTWLASRHFLSAGQVDPALALLQNGVVTDFLRDPGLPGALDLSMITPALIANSPHQLLAVAADLLFRGDTVRGGEYLDLFERTRSSSPPEPDLAARFAALRSFYYEVTGELDEAVSLALEARASQDETPRTDEWNVVVPSILLRVYAALEDVEAVEREAALARAMPAAPDAVKRVMAPGSLALAWFEAGRLADAAQAAESAAADATALGFGQHFFAVDHLRALAGLALERRDLDTAEQLTEQVLSITEHRRPVFEFLALLDRAGIWAARGQAREALATVEAARELLAGTRTVLQARADEQEALLRLSVGDMRSSAELAIGLPGPRRGLLLARIALAKNDPHTAHEHLQLLPLARLSPRRALVRQLLLAAAAIERSDPTTTSILLDAIQTARHGGFLNTVVTTAPQVTGYLIEHSTQLRPDPFIKQLIAAALDAHATRPGVSRLRGMPAEALTAAELRILKLVPTSTYLQMAATLGVSRNTVKTHLRSIYQKLCVASRSEAIERAIDLGLL
jgi:LuxR family transcriptional regulator, maltose regulon positive regulatory protein